MRGDDLGARVAVGRGLGHLAVQERRQGGAEALAPSASTASAICASAERAS
jgi:hypothetical protein